MICPEFLLASLYFFILVAINGIFFQLLNGVIRKFHQSLHIQWMLQAYPMNSRDRLTSRNSAMSTLTMSYSYLLLFFQIDQIKISLLSSFRQRSQSFLTDPLFLAFCFERFQKGNASEVPNPLYFELSKQQFS